MVKTEWDRLLLSFIPVAAVARFLVPRVIHPWKTLSIQVCNIPMTCVSVFKNEQLLLNWCVTVSKSARRICCWLSFLVKLQTDQQSVSVTQTASINDYWRAVLWPLPVNSIAAIDCHNQCPLTSWNKLHVTVSLSQEWLMEQNQYFISTVLFTRTKPVSSNLTE